MKKLKPRKLPKVRNYLVPVMWLHCKPGALTDKKKEAARRACRVKLRPGGDYLPAFFVLGPPELTCGSLRVRVPLLACPAVQGWDILQPSHNHLLIVKRSDTSSCWNSYSPF
jgi:hypothetical protein